MFAQDCAAVNFRRCRPRWPPASWSPQRTTSRTLPAVSSVAIRLIPGMLAEECSHLRERYRMGSITLKWSNRAPGAPIRSMHDGNDHLADDVQVAFDEQIKRRWTEPARLFSMAQNVVRQAVERAKKAASEVDAARERLSPSSLSRLLAERSAFPLKRHPRLIRNFQISWTALIAAPRRFSFLRFSGTSLPVKLLAGA